LNLDQLLYLQAVTIPQLFLITVYCASTLSVSLLSGYHCPRQIQSTKHQHSYLHLLSRAELILSYQPLMFRLSASFMLVSPF